MLFLNLSWLHGKRQLFLWIILYHSSDGSYKHNHMTRTETSTLCPETKQMCYLCYRLQNLHRHQLERSGKPTGQGQRATPRQSDIVTKAAPSVLLVPPLVPEASVVIPVGCCSPACCSVSLSHPHCTPLPGHAAHVLCNAAKRCSQVQQKKKNHNKKCSPAEPMSRNDLVSRQESMQEQWQPQNTGNFFHILGV